MCIRDRSTEDIGRYRDAGLEVREGVAPARQVGTASLIHTLHPHNIERVRFDGPLEEVGSRWQRDARKRNRCAERHVIGCVDCGGAHTRTMTSTIDATVNLTFNMTFSLLQM